MMNSNKCSMLKNMKMIAIQFHYLEEYVRIHKKQEPFVCFKGIYDSLAERSDVIKVLLKYCGNFDNLVDIKVNFENSIKITTEPDTKEILSVNSIFLNRKIIHKVIELLFSIAKESKLIISFLQKYSEQNQGVDFYYMVYLYFSIFTKRIPYKIKNYFSKIEIGENYHHLSDEQIGFQLEKYLEKYLSSSTEMNEIIIKFSKGIKIKYCSSNLCNSLGFSSISMVGEDFNSIFPKSLSDLHKKSMYNFIFGQQQLLFQGSAHIFDKNNNLIPCRIKGSALPALSKSLMMICEIALKKQNKMIALLDSEFTICSMTKSIEDKFFINSNLLKQSDTELYEIFDFQPKILRKVK